MNPFKALFVSCIIVLGNGTGRFLVRGAGTGLFNCSISCNHSDGGAGSLCLSK